MTKEDFSKSLADFRKEHQNFDGNIFMLEDGSEIDENSEHLFSI